VGIDRRVGRKEFAALLAPGPVGAGEHHHRTGEGIKGHARNHRIPVRGNGDGKAELVPV